jgi:hypothetical protein
LPGSVLVPPDRRVGQPNALPGITQWKETSLGKASWIEWNGATHFAPRDLPETG